MKARIIKIGNSQGVLIPKLLLKRSSLTEEVELEAQDHQIGVRSVKCPRDGWAGAFRTMSERGDDELLDKSIITQWDVDERQ